MTPEEKKQIEFFKTFSKGKLATILTRMLIGDKLIFETKGLEVVGCKDHIKFKGFECPICKK